MKQPKHSASITENKDEIDFSSLSIACLGDSITYGWDMNQQIEDPFPEIVGEELGLSKVYNYGIRGSTLTSGGKSKDPMCFRSKYLAKDADIIVVMGGVNDFWKEHPLGDNDSTDVNTVYGALNRIAYNLKQTHPEAFILFVSPMDFIYDYSKDLDVNTVGLTKEDLVKAIKDVAEKNNFHFLDLFHKSPFYDYNDKLMSLDKIHPTQGYTRIYAKQIANYIRDNYR